MTEQQAFQLQQLANADPIYLELRKECIALEEDFCRIRLDGFQHLVRKIIGKSYRLELEIRRILKITGRCQDIVIHVPAGMDS